MGPKNVPGRSPFMYPSEACYIRIYPSHSLGQSPFLPGEKIRKRGGRYENIISTNNYMRFTSVCSIFIADIFDCDADSSEHIQAVQGGDHCDRCTGVRTANHGCVLRGEYSTVPCVRVRFSIVL